MDTRDVMNIFAWSLNSEESLVNTSWMAASSSIILSGCVAFDICVAAFLLQMLNPTLLLELSKLKSNKGMLALDYWVMRDPVCTMFLCCPVSSTNLFCPCLESHFFLHSKEKILHYLLVLLSLIIARKC